VGTHLAITGAVYETNGGVEIFTKFAIGNETGPDIVGITQYDCMAGEVPERRPLFYERLSNLRTKPALLLSKETSAPALTPRSLARLESPRFR